MPSSKSSTTRPSGIFFRISSRRRANSPPASARLNGLADQHADPSGHGHRQRAPEADSQCWLHHRRAACPSAERAERDQKNQRGGRDGFHNGAWRRDKRRQRRQRGTNREGDGGCEGGLDRPGLSALAEAQLLAGVSVESVFGHELAGHFLCELRLQASFFVEMGKLLLLLGRSLAKRTPLARQISGLGGSV